MIRSFVICKDMTKDIEEDYYERFRRHQRIHRYHLIGFVIFAALVLIGMIAFWR